MANYLVCWEIDIIADTPEQAAQDALRIQRDCNSIATVFEVIEGCDCGKQGCVGITSKMVDVSPQKGLHNVRVN